MQFLIDKISLLNIGWNERPLGEDDFDALCRRFGITLQEMPLNTAGFYYRLLGRDFIAIDSKRKGPQRLAVLFHEFAHFLFHTSETGPAAGFHGVGRRTRKEIEADVFSLCAILPRSILETRSANYLINEGWPAAMIEERLEILQRYGL
jgi:Zn-dependent peptidase ImmA (M78 family)